MPGLVLACALVVTTTACSSASTIGPPSDSGEQEASAACGAIPMLKTIGTADLTGLPKRIQDDYAGYFTAVDASKYRSFDSKKSTGYKIGYSDSFSANSWRGDVLAQLNTAVDSVKASGQISAMITTNSNLDNNLQIQQITSMIDQRVDAIIAIPGSPTAFDSVIKQAFNAGIPFITLASHVDSPYAINIDENFFGVGVAVAAGLADIMSQSGSVVIVDGINGAPASKALHDGYSAAFSNCPNISVADSVEGQWSEAVTKAAMLQYLATNPGQIDGVINGGGETLGVIQALQQSNRKLVPIGDANPDKGSLVSLQKNLPDMQVTSTLPPVAIANAGLLVALGTLLGYQPKFDAVVGNPGVFTGADILDGWVQPDWLEHDSNQAPAPPGAEFLPQGDLPNFFAKPGALPQLPE
jgi:ABC-type sugar transport system substrate-binding protein